MGAHGQLCLGNVIHDDVDGLRKVTKICHFRLPSAAGFLRKSEQEPDPKYVWSPEGLLEGNNCTMNSDLWAVGAAILAFATRSLDWMEGPCGSTPTNVDFLHGWCKVIGAPPLNYGANSQTQGSTLNDARARQARSRAARS